MLFGQHFDGGPPRNLNLVFLRQFGNGFNKKIGMFMFKNQNDGAILRRSDAAYRLFAVGERCVARHEKVKTRCRDEGGDQTDEVVVHVT